jgi:hypothetical protein
MKLAYNKEINIEIGQEFYGIVAVSNRTYDGICLIRVDDIDWNTEEIIFKIDQPCQYVSCYFEEFDRYVFVSGQEAQEARQTLDYGEGMHEYQ